MRRWLELGLTASCVALFVGCKSAAPKVDAPVDTTGTPATPPVPDSALSQTVSTTPAASTARGIDRFAASIASAMASPMPPRPNTREVTAADVARLVNRATPDATRGEPIPVPPLHPILGKPFFEDVPPEVFCEAINSKEPDLWVRFGHLVPLYMPGAIYILQAGNAQEAVITDYIVNQYTMSQIFQQASCGDKTLLFVSNLNEEDDYNGHPYGRAHLGASLEVKLGLKVLEFLGFDAQTVRFAGYCRIDADACEAMIELNLSNNGTGLCPLALGYAGADADETAHNDVCRSLPASMKVCGLAYSNKRKDEKRLFFECSCRLRDALGLRKIAECIDTNP